MRHPALVAALAALVPTALAAQASTEEFAKEVLAAAPAHVAAGAAVAQRSADFSALRMMAAASSPACVASRAMRTASAGL